MSKNIVICADGTWNRKDSGADTNVARLFDVSTRGKGMSWVESEDGTKERKRIEQRKFYDPGVGTGRLKLTGGAFGWGISKNIKDCYRFLMAHYEEGDRLFLFGFSRGAFTVRSLAGMLSRVGLLKREYASEKRVKKAYRTYRGYSEYPDRAEVFRRRYCWDCDPHLIGVWDTVGALGIPVNLLNRWNPSPHRFHDYDLSTKVRYAYHALAIDDQRKTFHPTLWEKSSKRAKGDPKQVLEQVWFAGMHADVGGGYLESSLSDIPLRWMMTKAVDAGLILDKNYESIFADNELGMMHDSRLGAKRLFRREARAIEDLPKVHVSVWNRSIKSKHWSDPYKPWNLLAKEEVEWEPGDAKAREWGDHVKWCRKER